MSQKDKTAAPEVKEQLIEKDTETKVSESTNTESQVSETTDLDLEARVKAVESRELAADNKEIFLKQLAENLDEKEQSLVKREKAVEKKEKALENAKPGKKLPGLDFEYENENYKFKDSAPKTIKIDGQKLTQAQIIENNDLLLQLVGGNSGLIQKIN